MQAIGSSRVECSFLWGMFAQPNAALNFHDRFHLRLSQTINIKNLIQKIQMIIKGSSDFDFGDLVNG